MGRGGANYSKGWKRTARMDRGPLTLCEYSSVAVVWIMSSAILPTHFYCMTALYMNCSKQGWLLNVWACRGFLSLLRHALPKMSTFPTEHKCGCLRNMPTKAILPSGVSNTLLCQVSRDSHCSEVFNPLLQIHFFRWKIFTMGKLVSQPHAALSSWSLWCPTLSFLHIYILFPSVLHPHLLINFSPSLHFPSWIILFFLSRSPYSSS